MTRRSPIQVGAFGSGHWVTQLCRFNDPGAEEFRGMVGGMRFPFVHNWTYGLTEYPAQGNAITYRPSRRRSTTDKRPFKARRSTPLAAHAVTLSSPLIRSRDGKTSPSLAVYDRQQIRDIEFPSLLSTYGGELPNKMRRNGAQVEFRGIHKLSDDGSCAANLLRTK